MSSVGFPIRDRWESSQLFVWSFIRKRNFTPERNNHSASRRFPEPRDSSVTRVGVTSPFSSTKLIKVTFRARDRLSQSPQHGKKGSPINPQSLKNANGHASGSRRLPSSVPHKTKFTNYIQFSAMKNFLLAGQQWLSCVHFTNRVRKSESARG